MNWGALGHWEWIIIELAVLGVLLWELFSINRTIRRTKAAERTTAPVDPQP